MCGEDLEDVEKGVAAIRTVRTSSQPRLRWPHKFSHKAHRGSEPELERGDYGKEGRREVG
jgi:hypothetical protein